MFKTVIALLSICSISSSIVRIPRRLSLSINRLVSTNYDIGGFNLHFTADFQTEDDAANTGLVLSFHTPAELKLDSQTLAFILADQAPTWTPPVDKLDKAVADLNSKQTAKIFVAMTEEESQKIVRPAVSKQLEVEFDKQEVQKGIVGKQDFLVCTGRTGSISLSLATDAQTQAKAKIMTVEYKVAPGACAFPETFTASDLQTYFMLLDPSVVVPTDTLKQIVELMKTKTFVTFDYTQFERQSVQTHQTFESPKLGVKMALSNGQEINIHVVEVQKDLKQVGGWDISLIVSGDKANNNQVTEKEVKNLVRTTSPSIVIHKKDFELFTVQINAMPQKGGRLTQTLSIRQNNIGALKNNMMKFLKKTVENVVQNDPQNELNKRLAPSTFMYLLSNFQKLEVVINYHDEGGVAIRKYVLTITGKGNNMVNSVVTIDEIAGYLKQSNIDDLDNDILSDFVGQINGERNLKLEVSISLQDKSQVQTRLEDTDQKVTKIGQYWLNDNDLNLLREQNRNMFNADESGTYYFIRRQTKNVDKDIDFNLFLNQRQHLIDLQAKANAQPTPKIQTGQRESANLAQKTETADILNQIRQKGFNNFMNFDYSNLATGLLSDDIFREFKTQKVTFQTKSASRDFKFMVSYRFIDSKIYIPGEAPMDKDQFLAWKAKHQSEWVEAQKNQWDQIDLKQFEPPKIVHHIGSLTLSEEEFIIWRKENANVLLTEIDKNNKRTFYFDNKVISEADWPKFISENQNYEFTEKNGIWSVGIKEKSSGLAMEYRISNGYILIDGKQYTGAEFEIFISKYRPNFNEKERNFWKDITVQKIDDSQTVTLNNVPYNAAQFRQWRQENRDVLLTLMINNKLVYYYDNQEFDQAAWMTYTNQHKDKFELVGDSWQVKRQTKEFRQQKEDTPSLFVISPEGVANLLFKGGKKVEEQITVTFHNEDGVCYCNNKPCNWQEFVIFRKNEVSKLSAEDQWRYSQIDEQKFKKMQQVYQVGDKMMTREEFKEWAKNHPKNANPDKIDGTYYVRIFTFENKEYTAEELDEHFAANPYKGYTREGNLIKFSMGYNVNFQKDVITLNGKVVTWDVYKKWYDYWIAHGSIDTVIKLSKYDQAAYERSKNPPPYATYKGQTFATKELFDKYILAQKLNLVLNGDGTWKESTTVTETISIGYQIKDGVITAGGKIMTWEQFDAWRQKNQNYFDISDKARIMKLTIDDVERSKPYEFEGKFYTEEQLKKHIQESGKYTYTIDPVTNKMQIGMKKKTQTVVTNPQFSGTLITYQGQQYTMEQFQQKIATEKLPFRFKQVGQSYQIEDAQSVDIDIQFDGQFFVVNGQMMSAESLTAYLGKRFLPDFRDLYDYYVAFIADCMKRTTVVETQTTRTSGSTTNTQSSTTIQQIDFAAMGGITYSGFSSLSDSMKSLYLSGIFSQGTNIQQSQFVSEKNYGTSAHEITIKIDSVDCTFKLKDFNQGIYDYISVTQNQACTNKMSIGKFTPAKGLSCGQQGNKADIADKVGALMSRAKRLGVIKNNAVFDFSKVTGCGMSGGSYGSNLFGVRVMMEYEIKVHIGGSTCHFQFVERNSSLSYLKNYSSLDSKCKAVVNARRLV